MTDYQLLGLVIGGVSLVVTLGVAGVRMILGRHQTDMANRLNSLQEGMEHRDQTMQDLQFRVAKVENGLYHTPSHQDIRGISERIEQVHGDLKGVSKGLDGLNRAVEIMNTHLLGENGKQ